MYVQSRNWMVLSSNLRCHPGRQDAEGATKRIADGVSRCLARIQRLEQQSVCLEREEKEGAFFYTRLIGQV